MDNTKAIETLRQMIKKHKAADAVIHAFATRERARNQVTIRALIQRMKRDGFEFSNLDYAEVLLALSNCGFGTIKTNRRGGIIALENITKTLQSIGKAVLGEGSLDEFKARNVYTNVVVPAVAKEIVQATPSKPKPQAVKKTDKDEVLRSLGGVPKLIRAILDDSSVPVERRVNAALALLEK